MVPPSYQSGPHFHDEQEELYFVHRGTLVIKFGDGSEHEIAEGGAARVDASTVRSTANPSETEDLVYLVVGGKDGYVGRDGREPEGEGTARPPLEE
ncbi:MAG: cupin domain-containing protein [Actinobacteria bacterium]|nr:cupin domain-containing protein [Actinomycetota bacterium]